MVMTKEPAAELGITKVFEVDELSRTQVAGGVVTDAVTAELQTYQA
jgi:hypothetical protein